MANITKPTTIKKKKVLSKSEMVVAVAKDVLKQMKWLTIKSGTYFECDTIKNSSTLEGDLQELLPALKKAKKEAPCKVCALGACVVAKAKLYDLVPVGDLYQMSSYTNNAEPNMDGVKARNLLEIVFEPEQLDLIECAFETSVNYQDNENTDERDARKAVMFGERYKKDSDRLQAIMENIIKNKGVFKP